MTGASEGIGRCYAFELARSGFNVMLVSRSEQKLEKVRKEIADINQNLNVKCVSMDLTKTNDFSSITGNDEITNNLALVVNNAGSLMFGKFLEMDPEKLH